MPDHGDICHSCANMNVEYKDKPEMPRKQATLQTLMCQQPSQHIIHQKCFNAKSAYANQVLLGCAKTEPSHNRTKTVSLQDLHAQAGKPSLMLV